MNYFPRIAMLLVLSSITAIHSMDEMPMDEMVINDFPQAYLDIPQNSLLFQFLKQNPPEQTGLVAGSHGTSMITVSKNNSIGFWDIPTGDLRWKAKGHKGRIKSVLLNSDGGKSVITNYDDGTAYLWDVKTGELLWKSTGNNGKILYKGEIISVLTSLDEKMWIVNASDGTAYLRNVGKDLRGHPPSALTGHESPLMSAFHMLEEKKKTFITISYNGKTYLWRYLKRKGYSICFELKGHDGCLIEGQVDNNTVVACSTNGKAYLWKSEDKGRICIPLTEPDPNDRIIGIVSSKDVKTLISNSSNGRACLFDPLTGQLICTLKGPVDHSGKVSFGLLSSDKKMLLAKMSTDFFVYNALTGDVLCLLQGCTEPITSASFSLDKKPIVITKSKNNTTCLWNPLTGRLLCEVAEDKGTIIGGLVSPTEKTMFFKSEEGKAYLWKCATGPESPKGGLLCTLTDYNTGYITSGLFSHDGASFLTLSRIAHLWDGATGKPICRLEDFKLISSALFSSQGKTLLMRSVHGIFYLIRASTGEALATFNESIKLSYFGSSDLGPTQLLSPDKRVFFTRTGDGRAYLRNASTNEEFGSLADYGVIILALFSDDGRFLLMESNDSAFYLLEASTGKLITEFKEELRNLDSLVSSSQELVTHLKRSRSEKEDETSQGPARKKRTTDTKGSNPDTSKEQHEYMDLT